MAVMVLIGGLATAPSSARATTNVVRADADTFVSKTFPLNTYGTWGTMFVNRSDSVGYVRFSGLAAGATQATLRLRSPATTARVNVVKVGNNWSAGSLNWNGAAKLAALSGPVSGARVSGDWVTVDVTGLVQSGGTVSFRLTAESGALIGIDSIESGANAPKLEVRYGTPSGAAPTLPAPTTLPASTTTPTPTTTVAPTTTTTTPSVTTIPMPSVQDDSSSLCARIQTAAPGTTVTVASGTYAVGDCVIEGGNRADVRVIAASSVKPRLVGSLRCNDCDNWLFSGLMVEGDGTAAGGDPVFVVGMKGGAGWRWTDCDISNGADANGVRFAVRGVFNTFGAVRDWQLDNCAVHDNGNTRPTVADNNFDHLVYINGADVDSNGRIGPNNRFFGNASGSAVKIGFGLQNGLPVGIRDVRFDGNEIAQSSSPDGICGVLVAGGSAGTVVSGNRIDCTGGSEERTRTAIALRDWPAGTAVTIADNRIAGAQYGGNATACGVVGSGSYDRAITVRVYGSGEWRQMPMTGCAWRGITSGSNTSVR